MASIEIQCFVLKLPTSMPKVEVPFLILCFSEESPVNLHGTLIAQEILHFNKPIKLVNSILASDSEKLCQILSDPRGCHITDAFMTSSTIGEKSRESFIKVLQQNGLGNVIVNFDFKSFTFKK